MTNAKKLIFAFLAFSGFALFTIPFASAEEVSVSMPEDSSNQDCANTETCYVPYMITVNPGDTVIWSNDDFLPHTVTTGMTPKPDGLFDSGVLLEDEIFSYTFDTLGEYDYFCTVHPWMIGQVLVTVGGGTEQDLGTITMGTTIDSDARIDELVAEITSSDGKVGEAMTIDVTITDLANNPVEHITYNVQAIQGTIVLLNDEGHMHQGTTTNTHTTRNLTIAASDDTPVTITVNAIGFGHGEQYQEVFGEIATKRIVPEFGTIAVMILVISVVSIIAITTKSQIIPKL